MIDLICKYMELSRQEHKLLIQAMFLLPVVALCLRVMGFKRTRHLVETHLSRKKPITGRKEIEPQRVIDLVNIAGNRGLYRTNCLKKALASWALLAANGFDPELKIGVRKSNKGRVEAHAWVEVCKLSFNDQDGWDFHPFVLPHLAASHTGK